MKLSQYILSKQEVDLTPRQDVRAVYGKSNNEEFDKDLYPSLVHEQDFYNYVVYGISKEEEDYE